MAVQIWQGYRNGRVYDARSVTVVGHAEKELQDELTNDKDLNKRDRSKVEELQEWWSKEGKEKQSQSEELQIDENQIQFCDIRPSNKIFNIMCKIHDQVPTKITRCKVLRVSDNTKACIPIVYLEKDGETYKTEIGRDVQDIFVTENLDLMKLAKAGKRVILKGVQCVLTSINGKSDPVYKFLINADVKSDCNVLSATHDLQNKDEGSMPDSEFDRMLANAIQLPDTEESSIEVTRNKNNVSQVSEFPIDVAKLDVGHKNNTANKEKTDDSEEVSIPVFPVNTGPLIIRPCTSTDESSNTEEDNNLLDDQNIQPATNIEESERVKEIDIDVRQGSNLMITTDVSFEALSQLEKSVCGPKEICRKTTNTITPDANDLSTNEPDSMQAVAGSQEDEPDFESESYLLDESGIPASIRSPSPCTKTTFAIRSSSNFPLISSLADLNTKKASETFRIVGYVREIRPNILRCQNNLILLHAICEHCCLTKPLLRLDKYENLKDKNVLKRLPDCENCNEQLILYLHLNIVVSDIEMPQPLPMRDSAGVTSEFKLAGTHAEYLLGISAQNFFFSADVQTQAMERLASVIDQRVELSIVVIEAPPRREYQIINSYIPSDNEEQYP